MSTKTETLLKSKRNTAHDIDQDGSKGSTGDI